MSLPRQRISLKLKTEKWKKDTIDYFDNLSNSNNNSSRATTYTKRINYDLFNGKFNKADLEYVCNPLGLSDHEFPATLQHYDIISPSINLLIGEETKRPDNSIVFSESPSDINRKQDELKQRIIASLQQKLAAEIDPSTVDPNNPPPEPEVIVKNANSTVSDLIEKQANSILKYLKKKLNTKEEFKRGWKDALIAGEEIYWVGISNDEVYLRRCNPINLTIILDGDTEYIDDAIAVTEVRMLAPSTIIDEFGSDMKPDQVKQLEDIAKRFSTHTHSVTDNPTFVVNKDGGVTDTGITNFSSLNSTVGGLNSELIRVVRVEWKSFKKLYHVTYTDDNGELQAEIVDESFSLSTFKVAFPDAKAEEFWINEAWEGIKIHDDIYVAVQPKENQRRRMDNPYHCKLGYTGVIYNSTNSQSISLVDRLKPYQYLYNVISYRLELAFASDQGKIMLMDLAQVPRSEGMDLDRWMYYLKAMKIGFINSFEEGRKGATTGKLSNFNQFQSIDLSLAGQIQQYIQTLDYIKQQVAFISGVSPQRLGAISSSELVGNVERSVNQSALITEYLFDSHDEVKKRVYTALIECAKIAFRNGKLAQYVLDDMSVEILDIPELQLENSEFGVFMTNATKDLMVVETLKQLSQAALQSDKADLSMIIDGIINDNPRTLVRNLQLGEQAKYDRDRQAQEQQMKVQQEQIQADKEIQSIQLDLKQRELDLKQYEVDTNNETKIQVAEINAMRSIEGPTDMDGDGIPDPVEVAKIALEERNIASKAFQEKIKMDRDTEKSNRELNIKEREMEMKRELENKKIEAIKVQNASQEKIAAASIKMKEKELAAKERIEKIKARNKNKSK